MDLATIIGLVSATGLIIAAILQGGDLATFINLPGLLIVVGGTFAASFVKFSVKDVINSIQVVMKTFILKIEPPDEVIEKMIYFAKVSKKDGLVALEGAKKKRLGKGKDKKAGDEFAGKALDYLADGYDEVLIKELLNKDIRITAQRHALGQNVFKGMGAAAPAFGMIGTLIGLVQMLANMSDPASIGPSMAVALLTTLYGALVANVACLPLADKLALRSQEELETRQIILDAAIGINRAVSPMVLEQSLSIYLAPKVREERAKKTAGKGAKKGPKR